MEVAVAFVVLDLELAEVRYRPFPGDRIFEINLAATKQFVSFAADIADLADKAVRQLALDHQVPILVIAIAPMDVNALRAGAFGLQLAQKWSNRIREVRHVGRGK